jgi:CHAT domain-containing protein
MLAQAYRSAVGAEASGGWLALPNTRKELTALKATAGPRAVRTLTAVEACTDRVLSELPASRWAHFATHGFFADPSFRSAMQLDEGAFEDQRLSVGGERRTVAGRNPLVLSGLVFAGANLERPQDDFGIPQGDGGILTAEAIAGLPLHNLELAVLSACETGLGEVAGGEGVFGLQRAFHAAGARSVIASLWKVDDAATQALMAEFYKNLWEKKLGKLESLRQAQLAMVYGYEPKTGKLRAGFVEQDIDEQAIADARRRLASEKKGPLPPFYWAAFTLSGDWR